MEDFPILHNLRVYHSRKEWENEWTSQKIAGFECVVVLLSDEVVLVEYRPIQQQEE